MLDAEGLQQRSLVLQTLFYVQRKPGSWKKEKDGETTVNKHHARVHAQVNQTTDAKSTDPISFFSSLALVCSRLPSTVSRRASM